MVKEYDGKLRVVFKHLMVHPQVDADAHKAACAAAKQGKFIAFTKTFWEKGYTPYATSPKHDAASMGADNIMVMAKEIGLDTAKLKADMESPDCQAQIAKDMEELQKFHVNATPTFFINGKHVGGALPKEGFKQLIDEKLKIAEASGVAGAEYYDKEVMAKGEKKFRSKLDPKPN